jgi:hypothetical protein
MDVEQNEKAGLLWNSFKGRLGLSIAIIHSTDISQFFPYFDRLE